MKTSRHSLLTIPLVLLLIPYTGCDHRPPADNVTHGATGEDLDQYHNARSLQTGIERMLGTPGTGAHPPIQSAHFLAPVEADRFLADDDRVLVLERDNQNYVYPELILTLHHVINDTLEDGQAVAITYCLTSGCAALYSRDVGGQTTKFGGLGTFYNGRLVLVDESSNSYWAQFTGEAFHGKLRGMRLKKLEDLRKTTWGHAKTLPRLAVLAPEVRVSVENYRGFFENVRRSRLGVEALKKKWHADERLPAYTEGIGIQVHGAFRFYPIAALEPPGAVEDQVGGWKVLVVVDAVSGPARIFRRMLADRALSFRKQGDLLVDQQTQSRWNLNGQCVEGSLAGSTLTRPDFTQSYWFAWAAFHPETTIWSRR